MNISHEERFLRILFPVDVRVWKRTLFPLTIGHLLLLRRMRCPFGHLTPILEMDFTPGDLALAITVCERSWREAWHLINKRPLTTKWRLFRNTIINYDDLAVAAIVFSSYVEDSFARPATVELRVKSGRKVDGPSRLNAPFLQVLVRRLCERHGITTFDALDVPLKLALWDDACASEDAGVVRWCNEAEESVAEQVKLEISRLQKAAEGIAN